MIKGAVPAACIEQGVELSEDLLRGDEYILRHPRYSAQVYAPTDALRGIAVASALLTKDPNKLLIENQTPIDISQPEIAGSVADTAFASILNATIQDSQEALPLNFSTPITNMRLDACSGAEPGFAAAFRSMRFRSPKKALAAEVFVDEDGEPVMVRKRMNVASALTLRGVFIDDIPYGAGTIVQASTGSGDNPIPYRKGLSCAVPRGIRVRPVADIESVAPLRMSVFALPPEERPQALQDFNPQTLGELFPTPSRIADNMAIRSTGLHEFQQIAGKTAHRVLTSEGN